MGRKPNIINIKSHVGPQDSIAGKIISINLKAGSMFAIGDIKLTPNRYWAKVSSGMDKQYYDILQNSLQAGTIVLGKKYIPPVDKNPEVLEEYWKIIKERGKGQETLNKLRKLIRIGSDRNFSPKEISEYCIDKEKKGRNRQDVLALLNELATFSEEGVENSLPAPYDDEEGKVEILIDPVTKVAIPKNLPPLPVKNPDTSKETNKILDNLLG